MKTAFFLIVAAAMSVLAAPVLTPKSTDVDDLIVYPEPDVDDTIVYPEPDADSEIIYPDLYTDD
ncbi:hypothetical protein B0T26DRAFT_757967 [Lasiosphaeria miniovina]|uniref:Uncharacterized protein n=2 Tax=Lasiosphaeria TaxID=92901 RepID=A0AA40DFY2_9PEZI|nr:uncharacterized protein B0T26DRAFT_757967 [Lasiosphaeria miniovina]KAK0702004.1 hypothetical protein B0T26DRAFT_757967 [Lasiosphaeria miniovina]KAK3378671.1 hypothetical protein B0T24DRAFT_674517 [Lasiosphaeria ovina]